MITVRVTRVDALFIQETEEGEASYSIIRPALHRVIGSPSYVVCSGPNGQHGVPTNLPKNWIIV